MQPCSFRGSRGAVVSLLKSLGQFLPDRPGSIVRRTITCAVPGRSGERSTFSTTDPPDASERESPAPYQDRCALRGESPFHNPSRRLTGLLTAECLRRADGPVPWVDHLQLPLRRRVSGDHRRSARCSPTAGRPPIRPAAEWRRTAQRWSGEKIEIRLALLLRIQPVDLACDRHHRQPVGIVQRHRETAGSPVARRAMSWRAARSQGIRTHCRYLYGVAAESS